jgi:hypothetical protein
MRAVYCDLGKDHYSPLHVSCISCQRQSVPCPFGAVPPQSVVAVPAVVEKAANCKQPNKTELEYGRRLGYEYPGCEVRYEALTLILMLDGQRFRYSPDWVVLLPGGGILCVEVKNAGYQHASYGRARLAFAACRVAWPMFSFRWAVKDAGSWSEENYDRI